MKIIRRALFFSFLLSFLVIQSVGAAGDDRPQAVILKLQKEINSALNKMDADSAVAARDLQKRGVKGSEARKIIAKLKETNKYAVDSAAINAKGIMVIIEPKEYRKLERSDISGQEQFLRLKKTEKPVLSDVFKTVEGFYAADIQHPVFSSKGQFIGSASLLFKPECFLSSIIEPAIKDLPLRAWVMQRDGRILYDADVSQIGKNLFEDPLYKPFPSLLRFGKEVIAKKDGSGLYDFYDTCTTTAVTKDSVWATVGIHGTEWRVIVTKNETTPSGNKTEDAIIRSQAQTAVSMLQAIYDKYKKGEMNIVRAKKFGADLLNALRYGDEKEGYFWVDTVEGVNVVHPITPELEGKNRYEDNINGVCYVKDLIANGQRPNGGFTNYWYPKKYSVEPCRKRAYTIFFKPFEWVIGTGYYIE